MQLQSVPSVLNYLQQEFSNSRSSTKSNLLSRSAARNEKMKPLFLQFE